MEIRAKIGRHINNNDGKLLQNEIKLIDEQA